MSNAKCNQSSVFVGTLSLLIGFPPALLLSSSFILGCLLAFPLIHEIDPQAYCSESIDQSSAEWDHGSRRDGGSETVAAEVIAR